MKKTIAIILCLMFGASFLQSAFAGDREWATAGKILTGIIGASILADALDSGHSSQPYYGPQRAYRYAAPIYQEETPRPLYYNSRSLAHYPSSAYQEYGNGYGADTVYYEEEYVEPVRYRRRVITRTY